MAAPHTSRPVDQRVLGYRFAGVVLDLRRQTLAVDGTEVATTPLMLRLARLLCEADGRVIPRDELFDQLWPGGQEVSDSSLSQLVWRLRGALGPYGELVATVRRSGLRLDAAVSTEVDFQRATRRPAGEEVSNKPATPTVATPITDAVPHTPVPTHAPPSTHDAPARVRPSRTRALIGAVVLAALVAFAAWRLLWPHPAAPISAGYGLNADDLQVSRPETVALATSAFAAVEAGDRSRASALMHSLHDSDPTTPVPALMLAWWASDSAGDKPQAWIDAARQRLTPQSSPYVRLLCDYFSARATDQPIHGPLAALLDLRPQAWYLRYSLAHEQLARRELPGALRSLRQIPLDIPNTQDLAQVLADRVSLGDAEAATLALRHDALNADPVLAQFLRGRVAYSQGRLDEAVDAFDRCTVVAAERHAYQNLYLCHGALAAAAVERGATDAARRVDAASRYCHEQDRSSCEAEMLGLRALLEQRGGQANAASATLASAWKASPSTWMQVPLLLIALENGLDLPGDVAQTAAAVPGDPVFGGVAETLLGWAAHARGDDTEARRQLGVAREHGIAHTWHAEDAALLAARLGETQPPCRVDPPYPNVLRLTACLALRDEKSPAAGNDASPR